MAKFSAYEDGLGYLGKCEKKARIFSERKVKKGKWERKIENTSRFIYKLAVARVLYINPKWNADFPQKNTDFQIFFWIKNQCSFFFPVLLCSFKIPIDGKNHLKCLLKSNENNSLKNPLSYVLKN